MTGTVDFPLERSLEMENSNGKEWVELKFAVYLVYQLEGTVPFYRDTEQRVMYLWDMDADSSIRSRRETECSWQQGSAESPWHRWSVDSPLTDAPTPS